MYTDADERLKQMMRDDPRVRDDFFAWMAERVDRWPDWGGIAWRKGGPALTDHLLGLLATRLSGS